MKFKKRNKFVVIIDERGNEKLYLRRLLKLIKKDYGLTEKNAFFRYKSANNAKKGDVLVFGLSKSHDFSLISSDDFDEISSVYPVYLLTQELGQIKKELKRYYDLNYERIEEDEEELSFEDFIYIDEDDFEEEDDDLFIIFEEKPKKKKQPKKYLDTVKVYGNHVQVGFDNFKIKNVYGKEYVRIDGNLYRVIRDSAGNGQIRPA